jgi:hypothetical protein
MWDKVLTGFETESAPLNLGEVGHHREPPG